MLLSFFWRHQTAVTFGIVALVYSGYIPLSHGGFYCDDASIGFERVQTETFDIKLLLFICVVPMMALVRPILCIKSE